MRQLLDERGISLHTRVYAGEVREGERLLVPQGAIPAERAVALPRLQGERIDGIPRTIDGFIPIGPHGNVVGTPDVFAAGDITALFAPTNGTYAREVR